MIKTIAIVAMLWLPLTWAADRYADFADLITHEREGVDYEVETSDVGSPISVIAIHGGRIEPGSAEIARTIAGNRLNLYIFRAMKRKDNWDLHITSNNFDDPRAVEIAENSIYAISIHGYSDTEEEIVCIGGGNSALRDWVAEQLKAIVKVENPCRRFNGLGRSNIVNRAAEQGVQLEISMTLRKKMKQDPALMQRFASTVCEAMLNF